MCGVDSRAHEITNRQGFMIGTPGPSYCLIIPKSWARNTKNTENTKNSSYALLASRTYFTASNSGATHGEEMLVKLLRSRKCSSSS